MAYAYICKSFRQINAHPGWRNHLPEHLHHRCSQDTGFPGGWVVKICLPKQETWVWSLGQEDPLEKEMATHSSILAWEIPQTEEPGGLQSMGSQRIRHDWATKQQQHLRTWLTIQKSISPKRCWMNPGNAHEIRMKAGVWAPQRVMQGFMLLTCSPLLGQAELYPEVNASLQDGETHQASPGQEKHLFTSLAIQI